jgi:hypothetical protein
MTLDTRQLFDASIDALRAMQAAIEEAARCKARVEINGKTIWSATDGE